MTTRYEFEGFGLHFEPLEVYLLHSSLSGYDIGPSLHKNTDGHSYARRRLQGALTASFSIFSRLLDSTVWTNLA